MGTVGDGGAGSRPLLLSPFAGQSCCRIIMSVPHEVQGRAEAGLFKRSSRVPRKQTERASQSFSVSLTPLDVPEPATKPALSQSTACEAAGSGQMRGCPPCCAVASWTRGVPFKVGGETRCPGQPWAFSGARRVNTMWPPCSRLCQGWQMARHWRGHVVRAGVGRSCTAEEAPALPQRRAGEEWHWGTGPDTGCSRRFWAGCCGSCLCGTRKCRAEPKRFWRKSSSCLLRQKWAGGAAGAGLLPCAVPVSPPSPALVPHL